MNVALNENVSGSLGEHIAQNGLKRGWVAEKVGIHINTVAAHIRGDSTPDVVTAGRYAEVLGVPLDVVRGWFERAAREAEAARRAGENQSK